MFALMEYITVATNIGFHGIGVVMYFGEGVFDFSVPVGVLHKSS